MFYSKERILEQIDNTAIVIEPFSEDCLDAVSYELHLGDEIIIVSPTNDNKMYQGNKPKEKEAKVVKIEDGYTLNPGNFVLAKTKEKIRLDPNTLGFFDNKASLAQIGLFVDISSKLVDPGFEGNITCELYNAGGYPIILSSDQKIGQIIFAEVE